MALTAFCPAHAATIDLGVVALSTQLNATITDSLQPLVLQQYGYTQLVFQGSNLGMVLDGGMTVAEVLANDLGSMDPGSLSYNFPISGFGASGSYTQTSSGEPPTVLTLVVTSVMGHTNPNNQVGGQISVDLTKSASTYLTILNHAGSASNGVASSNVTVTTLTLGTIGSTTYQGENVGTTWQVNGSSNPAGPSSVPEPGTVWFAAAGCTAVLFLRRRLRGQAF